MGSVISVADAVPAAAAAAATMSSTSWTTKVTVADATVTSNLSESPHECMEEESVDSKSRSKEPSEANVTAETNILGHLDEWSEALEEEYQSVTSLIKNNLKLSPYDPSRWLNLIVDGSATHGMGWILFQ